MWLVQGAAIYINIAAPCTTEIHIENQHLTLLVKPRVQPRFLHHLLILCFSCNPVIPKNKKSPKHFPFSVKIPIFASVPRAERSNAAKPAQLPNRYRLPNFLLFKSYLPTDYKKTIVFFIKVPAKALEHPGKPAFNIRMSGGQTPGCTDNKHPGVQHQISLSC